MATIACFECNGEGQTFESEWMNCDPSSYADYEETWCDCARCHTKGYLDAGDLFEFIQESPLKNTYWLLTHYKDYVRNVNPN